jgi:succinyl-CoA synthetase alpha subunit
LKEYATERGLLMMGPGCGTAIINGVALGFANVVPPGPGGIVSAAGTGLQEVSSLLARQGVGVSQAIGTGGRDLHESVGGRMMLAGLQALQDDADTEVVVLISKPPSAAVTQRVLAQVGQSVKPTVVCFLGSEGAQAAAPNAIPARTLQEAALLAAAAVQGHKDASVDKLIERESIDLQALAARYRERLQPGQRYLRGLFSGGTLAAESLVVWSDMGLDVWSNVAVDKRWKLQDTTRCAGHCALDLGEEEFTVGRPHPMIDNDLRTRRLRQEAEDPETAVVMLDVVLGYGAHLDPAAEFGPAIGQARAAAAVEGRDTLLVASVTGTADDPQGMERQVQALESAGVMVCDSNAAAARLAGFLVSGS